MKPVDDIYIYIYIFQHGRLVYTEGHAGGAALGVLEGLLDRRARLARLMGQRSFAHYAMVPSLARDIRVKSESFLPPDGAALLRSPRHGARTLV